MLGEALLDGHNLLLEERGVVDVARHRDGEHGAHSGRKDERDEEDARRHDKDSQDENGQATEGRAT